ncbi:hypothetical protein GALMADRAFT_21534, partial [Galerina marginata CBS 339.88]
AGKYFQLASFVMMVYDHMITFSEEVEQIWRRPFTGVSWLFLINRYITPLQFIIVLDAFEDPRWTKASDHSCRLGDPLDHTSYNFVHRSWVRLSSVFGICISKISSDSSDVAEPLPPVFAAVVWISPLMTDITIFLLTIWKTKSRHVKISHPTSIFSLLVRDGALYFSVICTVNFFNMLMFLIAPPDLRVIGASFSQLLTLTMVSRLVLNLRSM